MLPDVDGVTVVTPTTTHYEIARYCLEQGKHVFVEKPLCFTLEEGETLIQLAQQNKRILSVGYVFRFNPLVRRWKELLSEIGDIQYITGRYIHSNIPPRKDSGAVFNLAIHMIDVLNHVLPDQPRSIYSHQSNHLSAENEDSAFLTINYGRFAATLEVSCCHPLKKREMWIIGSKEKVYLDFLDQVMIRYPLIVSENGTIAKEAIRDPLIEKTQPLFEELWHFCQMSDKVKKGETITNLSAENLLTTKMCLLALQSAKEKRVVTLE